MLFKCVVDKLSHRVGCIKRHFKRLSRRTVEWKKGKTHKISKMFSSQYVLLMVSQNYNFSHMKSSSSMFIYIFLWFAQSWIFFFLFFCFGKSSLGFFKNSLASLKSLGFTIKKFVFINIVQRSISSKRKTYFFKRLTQWFAMAKTGRAYLPTLILNNTRPQN